MAAASRVPVCVGDNSPALAGSTLPIDLLDGGSMAVGQLGGKPSCVKDEQTWVTCLG
ncbi:hypothetical protein Micau_2477 [Micromonospora aurantiaca ATCC 27029]|nr:hypothetical protein Micau_2477 [Micromonospora aurantiaca ATCC 27029]